MRQIAMERELEIIGMMTIKSVSKALEYIEVVQLRQEMTFADGSGQESF